MPTQTKSATETLTDLLTPKQSMIGSTRTEVRRNGDKALESVEVFKIMEEIVKPMGIELQQPRWNGDPYAYSDAIINQLVGNKVGRLEFEGDKVRYHWFETEKQTGIFQNTLTRVRKEHLVVNHRFHKLPYKRNMPKKAIEIHNKVCAVPALRRSCRVLTGILVGEAQQTADVWNEDTWLTKAGKEVAQSIGDAANAVITTVDGVTKAISETGSAMMDSFAIDPCIVIGNDIVLFGWKD